MINKFIRNFIAKQMAGRSEDGIMITLRDPQKVELGENIMADLLMRNGIDPRTITSEAQLKNILNQIEAASKQTTSGIRNTESAKVFDLEGKEIPKGSKIMGGKAIDDDLPPPGSRGGDEDIAAPVQSSEESLKNMIEAENKKNIAAMKKRKMLDEAIDNQSPGLTGDRKYDADIVAEDLAERMGLVYDDMPTKERLDLYDEAYQALTKKKFDPPEDLATGGRVGLKGGADAATESFSKSAGSSRPGRKGSVSISPSGNVTFNPGGKDDGPVDKSTFEQTINQMKPPKKQKSGLEKIFDAGQEFNYLKNLAIGNFPGIGKQLLLDYGKRKLLDDQAMLDTEENQNMMLAELTDMQKKMLEGPQKNLKDIMGISNEEILQNIEKFNNPDAPATIQDIEQFYQQARDGGRIGLKVGTGFKFLQKIFGKEKFKEMKTRDPEMYVGLLEVVDMYRKRDKEGLKMYLQKFLPHMDDAEIEAFIRGSDGSEGLIGELIRLGSGRDYQGKIEMMKRANEMRKLDDLEVTDDMIRKPNADGGIMRLGFKDGMNRRTFLKIFSGLVSLPIIGKVLKPLKVGKKVTQVPIIKTGDVPGKPEWFDQLVNKVILEGDDVTKRFATQERQVIHKKKIDDETSVTVTQDLNDGSIMVDVDDPIRNVMGESGDDTSVMMMLKKNPGDESNPATADEFSFTEADMRNYMDGPDDFTTEFTENTVSKMSDLTSDLGKIKSYATGKKPTMKEFIESKKRKDKVRFAEEKPAEYAAERGPEVDYDPEPDFASGGIARMLGE